MPEYLAPGVYIEEVSYRAKTIEGVATSTAGFVGPARFGPVGGEPELLTSFNDFERIYGGMDRLLFEHESDERENYLAHAVRAFFDNGGSRLYATRIFGGHVADGKNLYFSSRVLGSALALRARFPGRAGQMRITFTLRIGANVLVQRGGTPALSGLHVHDTVFVTRGPDAISSGPGTGFHDVIAINQTELALANGSPPLRAIDLTPGVDRDRVHPVTLIVSVQRPGRFEVDQLFGEFSANREHRSALTAYFAQFPSVRARDLAVPFWIDTTLTSGSEILAELIGPAIEEALHRQVATDTELQVSSPDLERPTAAELQLVVVLDGGSDGPLPTAAVYRGGEDGPRKTGLESFVDIEDISIVAAPGATAGYKDNTERGDQITQDLVTHVELMKYRVAVLDSPDEQLVSGVRAFRGKFDTKYAALYYPWIRVLDPLDPDGRAELLLPPSGHVAGIYARNDTERGVAKAPANEVVRGAIGFELLLNKGQQDVLNPEGVNCFRFFEGRGYRLWGARTISSDPEWKYISNRRYFAYLEHSIDRGTQWAVFENNSDPLWANVRRTIEDFLYNEWRNQALMGTKPEEAFFVRCDRSTMTQNDIDNGRLVCLIGVAIVRPAEFVIFRIGQWTADRRS
jgi:Bacteriophage tail sheath protein